MSYPALHSIAHQPSLLIVDDDLSILDLLTDLLESHYPDYSVLRANTASLALFIVGEHLPELIITDWEMPELNGLELVQRLKANPATADIPVIMFTGKMTSSQDLKQALETGACDYLRKPVDEIELLARVYSSLRFRKQWLQIQHLNQSQQVMFSVIAHHLNGTVVKSQTYLENLARFWTDPPEGLANNLNLGVKFLDDTGLTLTKLTQWSQLRFNPPSIQLQLVDPVALLDYILQSLPKRSTKITLQSHLSKGVKLTTEPMFLQQAVEELLNFMQGEQESNPITIKLDKQGQTIQLNFHQSRSPLMEWQIDQLLDPYEKRNLYTQGLAGAGLGLSICRELLHLFKASLSISNTNQGVCFTIHLPVTLLN